MSESVVVDDYYKGIGVALRAFPSVQALSNQSTTCQGMIQSLCNEITAWLSDTGRHPETTSTAANNIRQVVLVGPPECGKTRCIKAVSEATRSLFPELFLYADSRSAELHNEARSLGLPTKLALEQALVHESVNQRHQLWLLTSTLPAVMVGASLVTRRTPGTTNGESSTYISTVVYTC